MLNNISPYLYALYLTTVLGFLDIYINTYIWWVIMVPTILLVNYGTNERIWNET